MTRRSPLHRPAPKGSRRANAQRPSPPSPIKVPEGAFDLYAEAVRNYLKKWKGKT
jgi:hypothetical protein